MSKTTKSVRLIDQDHELIKKIQEIFGDHSTIEDIVSLAVNRLYEEAALGDNQFKNLVLEKLINIENSIGVLLDDGI